MPKQLLIVEDDQIIAADLRNKVRRMGYDVVGIAISGEEAIALAQELNPDLVLMDVQLEGPMSGVEAARTIQQRLGCPIIFVTAFPGVFIRDPAQMIPAGICLGKPFSLVQLEAALSAVFGQGESSRSVM